MKFIGISNNNVCKGYAIVDNTDYVWASKYKWSMNDSGYACQIGLEQR